MKNNTYLFTNESVSEGHPDKVCDGFLIWWSTPIYQKIHSQELLAKH